METGDNTRIKNKLVFKGKIRLTSALHIGGGTSDEVETQGPIVRNPAGEPYIPGSSIKGVFRSFIEQVIADMPGLKACQLNEKNHDFCFSVGKGFENWKNKNKNALTETAIANMLESNLCDACKVFGSPWRASKAFFADAAIVDWPEITQVRHGVVIDRDSETGVPNLKYDYEIIPASSTFDFFLCLENASLKEQAIVSIGINEMVSGLMQIGGKTSRGGGNFILDAPRIYTVDFLDMEQLKKYLKADTIESKMLQVEDIKTFIAGKIDSLFGGGIKTC